MQREIEALIRAISVTSGRRANVQSILQEILYAIQRHDTAIDEADQRLLDSLDRAISGTAGAPAQPQQAQAPRYEPTYSNGAWGPYANG